MLCNDAGTAANNIMQFVRAQHVLLMPNHSHLQVTRNFKLNVQLTSVLVKYSTTDSTDFFSPANGLEFYHQSSESKKIIFHSASTRHCFHYSISDLQQNWRKVYQRQWGFQQSIKVHVLIQEVVGQNVLNTAALAPPLCRKAERRKTPISIKQLNNDVLETDTMLC